MTSNSAAESFQKGLEEFISLEDLGCPYDFIDKNGKKLCSIDNLPCHLTVMPFVGPYCDRHGNSYEMDKKAGKNYWAEFFHYAKGLSPEERKKIFEKHVIEGDAIRDRTRWDSLLYHLKEAVVAKYGKKAVYTGK